MTPQTLRRAGELIHGPTHVNALAETLNVSPRTLRRWLTGAAPIPPTLATDLANALRNRAIELEALASLITSTD